MKPEKLKVHKLHLQFYIKKKTVEMIIYSEGSEIKLNQITCWVYIFKRYSL